MQPVSCASRFIPSESARSIHWIGRCMCPRACRVRNHVSRSFSPVAQSPYWLSNVFQRICPFIFARPFKISDFFYLWQYWLNIWNFSRLLRKPSYIKHHVSRPTFLGKKQKNVILKLHGQATLSFDIKFSSDKAQKTTEFLYSVTHVSNIFMTFRRNCPRCIRLHKSNQTLEGHY